MVQSKRRVGYIFMVMASVVIVLAGIKLAAVIVVPFLLSVFLAIILAPLFEWLKSLGLPDVLAIVMVMSVLVVLMSAITVLVGNSVQDFSSNLPLYEAKLIENFNSIIVFLEAFGLELPNDELLQMFDPKTTVKYIAGTLKNFGSIVTKSLMIMLMVIFMLLEISHFQKKFISLDSESSEQFSEISTKIKHYMLLKTVISMATGIIVSLLLMIIGVDYYVLWGLVAFLFNFIPNIGSIIAAVPAVILALVQFGPAMAVVVSAVYIAINIVVGSIIEPKVMGQGLGLSTLVVFLSLIFWGWLLGPVGMLLSIPLTIMVKIALDAQQNTKWIATLLA
ncbi:MAG: AI-2E family transporter [Campylobacterota bacterium]|nr:AI-2E family transporter [Campylobacterota bacterium]